MTMRWNRSMWVPIAWATAALIGSAWETQTMKLTLTRMESHEHHHHHDDDDDDDDDDDVVMKTCPDDATGFRKRSECDR